MFETRSLLQRKIKTKKCFSFLLNLWRPHKNEKEDCSITQDESVDEEDKVDDEDFQDDREIWEVTHVCV